MQVWLFDIDGTMIVSGGAGGAAFGRAMAAAFGAEPHTDGVSYGGRTDRAIARDVFALHGVEETEENWERFQQHYLPLLDEELSVRSGRVLPGVFDVLNTLVAREETSLGLVTGNVEVGARQKLARYELEHFFEYGGFGDTHHDRNLVSADAKAQAEAKLGTTIEPEQVIVVGDTTNDIRCARAIGAKVIAVGTGSGELDELAAAGADLVLEDLSDTQRLLDFQAG